MKKRIIFFALLTTAFFLLPAITRARDYNAVTGRFMTMDTFEGDQADPQSLHKYNYCQDDPINNTDPSGHDIGEELAVMDIGSSFFAAISPVTSHATTAAQPLPPLPTEPNKQLLLGLIFAESSTPSKGHGENDLEKMEIGFTALNRVYYAQESARRKFKYNKEFGNGTLLDAISYPNQFVSYMGPAWNRVMNGNQTKPRTELEKTTGLDRQHLILSINSIGDIYNGGFILPSGLSSLGDVPIAENSSGHNPSAVRWYTFAQLQGTTFYAFKPGREFK